MGGERRESGQAGAERMGRDRKKSREEGRKKGKGEWKNEDRGRDWAKVWKKQPWRQRGREAESHSEGHRGKGRGEPTRGGGRSEPVERRQPEAGVPKALKLGVVCCPPPPRGAGRDGGKQEGVTPGKEGTTPTAQGADGHGTHGERKGQGIKRDETKQKQRENQD